MRISAQAMAEALRPHSAAGVKLGVLVKSDGATATISSVASYGNIRCVTNAEVSPDLLPHTYEAKLPAAQIRAFLDTCKGRTLVFEPPTVRGIKVTGDGMSFTFSPPTDYYADTLKDNDVKDVNWLGTISAPALLDLISSTDRFQSEDESRPNLMAVQLRFAEGSAGSVATNGHCIARASRETNFPEPLELMVPSVAQGGLKAALELDGGTIQIGRGKLSDADVIVMKGARFELNYPAEDGFPEWEKITTHVGECVVVVDRDSFLAVIAQAVTTSSSKTNIVDFTLIAVTPGDFEIQIFSQHPEIGEFEGRLSASVGQAVDTKIRISHKYLRAALSRLPAGPVHWFVGGPVSKVQSPISGDWAIIAPMQT